MNRHNNWLPLQWLTGIGSSMFPRKVRPVPSGRTQNLGKLGKERRRRIIVLVAKIYKRGAFSNCQEPYPIVCNIISVVQCRNLFKTVGSKP
jgi:hypothetical protein